MINTKKCPVCKSDAILRNGKYGEFLGCSDFPKCKWSLSLYIDKEIRLKTELALLKYCNDEERGFFDPNY